MKKNVDLNKTAVVDYLCSNYEKFNWKRDDTSFDINMSAGNYTYRLTSTRSDERDSQVIAKGASLGVEVSAKEYKAVDELYDLVWEYTKAVEQDKQWNNKITNLKNQCRR